MEIPLLSPLKRKVDAFLGPKPPITPEHQLVQANTRKPGGVLEKPVPPPTAAQSIPVVRASNDAYTPDYSNTKKNK